MIMGKRNKVTTRDIAEYAGVSQSTVSMILSEKKNVSFGEETVENVKKAAKALGYHKPAKKKRTPDRSLSKTVMILCPTVSNGYYNAVIHSIVEKAQEYDYTTLTAVTFRSAEREDAYFKIFAENELAGVISLYPLSKYAKLELLHSEERFLDKHVAVVLTSSGGSRGGRGGGGYGGGRGHAGGR